MHYFKKKNYTLNNKCFLKNPRQKPLTGISSSIGQEVTHSKKRVCEAEVFSEGAYRMIMDGKLEISLKCNTAVKTITEQCRKRTVLQNSELRSVEM